MENNPSEKLTGPELVKKFHAFCGTRKFITVYIRGHLKQVRPCVYYITSRHVSATTVSVEKQKYYIF
jgi:hypothetical protein